MLYGKLTLNFLKTILLNTIKKVLSVLNNDDQNTVEQFTF